MFKKKIKLFAINLDAVHDNSTPVKVESDKLSEILMKNKEVRESEIDIVKIDADTKDVIDDKVIFELREGATYATSTLAKVKPVDKENGIYTVSQTTSENNLEEMVASHGRLKLVDLSDKNKQYYIVEKQAPEGYEISKY